jgi:multiple sugar transport system substrate-binding protein
MKKLVALSLALLLLAGICNLAGADDKIVITVTRWGDAGAPDPEQVMVDKFNAENDMNIEIVYDVVPGDGYGDRLTTSFSDKGYDIFASGEGDFYKWVGLGMTYPLNELIAADTDWNNEMNPAVFAMGNINGDQTYLIRDYNPLLLWYNKDVFDANGVDYPTDEWTWDDLIEAARQLTVKNDDGTYQSFGFNAQSWTYAALTYLTSLGLDIVDPTATEVEGYLDSPEVIEAMLTYVNFAKGDDRISPTSANMDAFGGASAMFINGTLAMTINGGWMRGGLVDAGCNYGTALAPGNHSQYLCAAGYTISSKCEHPEAAWEVLKLLTGRECSELKLDMDASVLPTIDALLEAKKEKSGPEDQGLLDALNYSVQPVGMRSKIGNPAATAFDRAMERLTLTDDDPAKIFADAVADVREALADMD